MYVFSVERRGRRAVKRTPSALFSMRHVPPWRSTIMRTR